MHTLHYYMHTHHLTVYTLTLYYVYPFSRHAHPSTIYTPTTPLCIHTLLL